MVRHWKWGFAREADSEGLDLTSFARLGRLADFHFHSSTVPTPYKLYSAQMYIMYVPIPGIRLDRPATADQGHLSCMQTRRSGLRYRPLVSRHSNTGTLQKVSQSIGWFTFTTEIRRFHAAHLFFGDGIKSRCLAAMDHTGQRCSFRLHCCKGF